MSAPVCKAKRLNKTTLAPWLGAVALLAVAGDAMAQGAGDDKRDPRREQSGAKVTAVRDDERQDKGQSDADLVNDSYQAKGVEMGQFLLLPKLEVGEQYNSNIYASAWNTKDDFITVTRPEVKLRSRFLEHELNFSALVEDYRLASHTDDNRTDFTTYVDGRYDATSDLKVTQFSLLNWGHEDRSSPDAVDGKSPTTTFTSTNRTGVEGGGGRLKLLGEAGYDRKEFGSAETASGRIINNSDRDRWELQLRQRGSYEMFPGYAAVVEFSENTHRYDKSADRNGFDRTSSGYRAEAGVGVDISKLIRGDFLVGYMQQNYRDPRFKDPSGVALRAAFNWTPTKMTSVMPTLERSVLDTTTARASGVVHNAATVTVKHELARNIILTGWGNVAYDQLQGVSDQDYLTYEYGARATYFFMPEVYVQGEAWRREKDADVDSSSFKATVMMVRLGLQY